MKTFEEIIQKNVLFDSHCHLNDLAYDDDRNDVVTRAIGANVEFIIDIGVDLDSSIKAIASAKKYKQVYASVGVDPEILIPGSDLFDEQIFDLDDVGFQNWLEFIKKELNSLAKQEKVIMIGETGIDNYWLQKSDLEERIRRISLDRQADLFKVHSQVAKANNMPLSIHSRNAIDKVLKILISEKIEKRKAVFHSLTPDNLDTEAIFESKWKEIINSGYYIGINAISTYKGANLLKAQLIKHISLNTGISRLSSIYLQNELKSLYDAQVLFETDGPFLAPAPYRGQRNEPSYLKNIIEALSL